MRDSIERPLRRGQLPPSIMSQTDMSSALRDQFAMAALQGMLASERPDQDSWYDRQEIARMAYELADKMLEARN